MTEADVDLVRKRNSNSCWGAKGGTFKSLTCSRTGKGKDQNDNRGKATWCPSPNDLLGRQKVFIHQQGKHTPSWLLQCRDDREAQLLGSTYRDKGIDKRIITEAATHRSLEMALTEHECKVSPLQRYCKPARQANYHRRYPVSEWVVVEVDYSDLTNN